MNNPYADLRVKLQRPLFIPFVVLGDPDPKVSRSVVQTLIESGADALELGFPFSDPTADGPIIQAADTRALESGMTIDNCFAIISDIRKTSSLPIGLLVYFNLLLKRGPEKFYEDCKKSGVTSVLIADLPLEHLSEVSQISQEKGIQQVVLVSELTSDLRLQEILKVASGYLYVVSYLGVTGAKDGILERTIGSLITRLRKQTRLPLFVGFGIGTREQAVAMMEAGVDGIVVGSRIVKEVPQRKAIADICKELLLGVTGLQ